MTAGENTPEIQSCESVKSHVLHYCGHASTHGFGRLAESQGIRWHLFWIVMLLAAHGAFYYQTYLIISEYLERPIRTKVSMRSGKSLEFPTVTLCNRNVLRKSKVPLEFLESISDITNVTTKPVKSKNVTRNKASNSALPDPGQKHAKRDEWERFRNLVNQYERKKLEEYGHQLEDMVLDCIFNGEDCRKSSDNQFIWRHMSLDQVGNCYMFNRALDDHGNTIESYKSHLPGDTSGLTLLLNIEQYDYLDDVSPLAGIRLVIGAQGQMPFPLSHGIDVGPGLSTSVELRMHNTLRLDPFGNGSCQRSGKFEGPNAYESYNMSYSKMACKASCLVLMQTKICQCAQFIMPSLEKYKFCDFLNTSVVDCLNSVYEIVVGGECDERCPPPCSETYFSTTISSSMWPSNNYKKRLTSILKTDHKLNLTTEEISDNLLELHVYYAELDYVRVEETLKYGIQDVMSSVGGQLGMWIGVSALSIAEVLELIIFIAHFLINKRKKESTVNVQRINIQ